MQVVRLCLWKEWQRRPFEMAVDRRLFGRDQTPRFGRLFARAPPPDRRRKSKHFNVDFSGWVGHKSMEHASAAQLALDTCVARARICE
jgi:hypothetical protein